MRTGRAVHGVMPHLDEQQRRIVAGSVAMSLGRGGITAVAEAAGMSRSTVTKAVGEIDAGHRAYGPWDPPRWVSQGGRWGLPSDASACIPHVRLVMFAAVRGYADQGGQRAVRTGHRANQSVRLNAPGPGRGPRWSHPARRRGLPAPARPVPTDAVIGPCALGYPSRSPGCRRLTSRWLVSVRSSGGEPARRRDRGRHAVPTSAARLR
jgi:hypothetical protein